MPSTLGIKAAKTSGTPPLTMLFRSIMAVESKAGQAADRGLA